MGKKPKNNLLTKYIISRGLQQLWVFRGDAYTAMGKYKGIPILVRGDTHHDALLNLLVQMELIDWNEMKQYEQVS